MQPNDVFLISKTLPLSAYPLAAATFISIATITLCLRGWGRTGLVVLGFALISLWIAATPGFANWINWRLESDYPSIDIKTLPKSDVVILLGGVGADLDNPGNRIAYAARLYQAGSAPLILISGADSICGVAASHALTIADRLIDLGVSPVDIIQETSSRNTRQNALNTSAIFKARGWRNGILVTSSAHMARALAAFQRVGLDVVPAPTGIKPQPEFNLLALEVNKGALLETTAAVKELTGRLVYRCLGWA
jgi:uncharacterized SAM-binding protein YcdF (DUF218 family)